MDSTLAKWIYSSLNMEYNIMLFPEYGLPDNPDKIIERIHDEIFHRLIKRKETPSKEWVEEIILRNIEDWGGWKWKDEIVRATMPDEFLKE